MLSLLLLAPALVAGLVQVSIEDFSFVPESVFVQPGDTVRWTNNGAQTHTATSVNAAAGLWNSGNMGTNKTYQFVFKNVGSYDYNCRTHSGMLGWVTVSTVTAVRTGTPSKLGKPGTEIPERALRDVQGRTVEAEKTPKIATPAFHKPAN